MSIIEDMQGITNLIEYSEQYPQGAVAIGHHYYKISSLMDALKDMKLRSTMGDISKADKLLMQILCGLM